jgi:predicted nucleic acid-binding Zn ribbon protein
MTTPVLAADEKVCPNCSQTVKAAAKVCRHCGFDFQAITSRRFERMVVIGLVVALVLAVVVLILLLQQCLQLLVGA